MLAPSFLLELADIDITRVESLIEIRLNNYERKWGAKID